LPVKAVFNLAEEVVKATSAIAKSFFLLLNLLLIQIRFLAAHFSDRLNTNFFQVFL